MNPSTPLGRLSLQSAAWIAVVLAYHAALDAWMVASGGRLGRVGAGLAVPLHAGWARDLPGPWSLPALAVLGVAFAVRERLFRTPRLAAALFVAAATTLFLCLALSLAVADGFVEKDGERMAAFLVQHSKPWLESYGDVARLDRLGLRSFCAMYSDPRRLPRLANHSRSHPPGPVLFQWLVGRVFGIGLLVPPLAELGLGSLLLALTYLLGREVYDDATARMGVALTLLAPNVAMFATSMDLPFAVFLLLGGWLFVRAARRGELATAVISGVAMALAADMTFTVGVLLVVLAFWFAQEWLTRPERRRTLLAVALVGSLAGCAAFGALLWATGYDVWRALPVQSAFNRDFMGQDVLRVSQYVNLSIANLMAFLVGLGVPLVCLTLRGLTRAAQHPAARDTLLLATSGALGLAAFSSIYSLEVERIWLFLTPLLALSAARTLASAEGAREFGEAVGLSCVLLWLMEAALVTAW
jgi:methylthioxylose transferase